jgi:hypothetical protein
MGPGHDPGAGQPLVVFGLGLGHHVLPLLQEDREIWVVEPSAAVARLALEHQDLFPPGWPRGLASRPRF